MRAYERFITYAKVHTASSEDFVKNPSTERQFDLGRLLVKELQDYITDHYYTCTKQILRGLGMMYIAGDEMTANIDAAGGEGTAQFAHEAIDIYCQ